MTPPTAAEAHAVEAHAVEAHLRAARSAGRKLLVPYVTGGVVGNWTDYLPAYEAAGADAVEIGLPFSDPMVDGRTIQQSSDRALARGTTVESILADLAAVRSRLRVPLVAMTYANLVVRRGVAPFCRQLTAAGIGALIVPDVPLDEIDPMAAAVAAGGIELVLLAAPCTAPGRLREICDRSRGFIYGVSTMGTTGERDLLDGSAAELAVAVKALTDRPILIGFGVSGPAHAAKACRTADGVVIASALMRRVLGGAAPAEVERDLAAVRGELDREWSGYARAPGVQIPRDRGGPDRQDPQRRVPGGGGAAGTA